MRGGFLRSGLGRGLAVVILLSIECRCFVFNIEYGGLGTQKEKSTICGMFAAPWTEGRVPGDPQFSHPYRRNFDPNSHATRWFAPHQRLPCLASLECALGSRRGRLGRGLRLRDLHSPAKNVFRESGLQSMACHGEIEDLCSSQHGGPDGHVSTTREPQSRHLTQGYVRAILSVGHILVCLWHMMASALECAIHSVMRGIMKPSTAFLASLLASLIMLQPKQVNAASICLPIPTPSGISRVCMDVGQDAERDPSEFAVHRDDVTHAREQYIPPFINAQRTPIWSEGNVLSRMGFRPMTMFSEARARISESARQRLAVMRAIEEMQRQEEAGTLPKTEYVRFDRDIIYKLEDPLELLTGVPNIPRSQLIADRIDPVLFMMNLSVFLLCFHRQLYKYVFRPIFLRVFRPDHTVVLVVQVAMRGEDSYHLSRTCRTLGMLVSRSINPLRLDRNEGVRKVKVRRGSSMLTPAVRYAAAIFRNFSRSPEWMHGRAEVDVFGFDSESHESEERFQLACLNEELRGLPKAVDSQTPGEYLYADPVECMRPGVAGLALQSRPCALDSDLLWVFEWEEAHYPEMRWASPVEMSVVYPPLRNREQQDLILDRQASNLDKVHKAKTGQPGGYVKKRIELYNQTNSNMLSQDDWKVVADADGDDDEEDGDPMEALQNRTDVLDVRLVDWEKEYSEVYGHEWKKHFPATVHQHRKQDAENLLALRELQVMARAEKAKLNSQQTYSILGSKVQFKNKLMFMRDAVAPRDGGDDTMLVDEEARANLLDQELLDQLTSIYGDDVRATRNNRKKRNALREKAEGKEEVLRINKMRDMGLTDAQIEVAKLLNLSDEDLEEYR
jgi:hypothetical protein